MKEEKRDVVVGVEQLGGVAKAVGGDLGPGGVRHQLHAVDAPGDAFAGKIRPEGPEIDSNEIVGLAIDRGLESAVAGAAAFDFGLVIAGEAALFDPPGR